MSPFSPIKKQKERRERVGADLGYVVVDVGEFDNVLGRVTGFHNFRTAHRERKRLEREGVHATAGRSFRVAIVKAYLR